MPRKMKAGDDHVPEPAADLYLNEIWYLEQRPPDHDPYIRNVQVKSHDKISDMEEADGETFVQCHQSFLVNMKVYPAGGA